MIPTPTGRARARSARARAPPRLYRLAGLRLTLLLLLLPCCSSRCSCSGLSSFPMLLRLFFRLQCSTLFSLSRFPFHDSQVYFWMLFPLKVALGSLSAFSWRRFTASWAVLAGSRRPPGSQEASGALRDRFWEALLVIWGRFLEFSHGFRHVCFD